MILDYLWRYPAYVNLLNIVHLVSVSYLGKAKTNQKLMEDKTLIAKLCAMMNLEPSEDNDNVS